MSNYPPGVTDNDPHFDMPSVHDDEGEEENACHVCHRPAVHRPDGRQLNYCDRCDHLVCDEHAEVDYDLKGDPGQYVCTQWVCSDKKRCDSDEARESRNIQDRGEK